VIASPLRLQRGRGRRFWNGEPTGICCLLGRRAEALRASKCILVPFVAGTRRATPFFIGYGRYGPTGVGRLFGERLRATTVFGSRSTAGGPDSG
jgi:hypothetical protein